MTTQAASTDLSAPPCWRWLTGDRQWERTSVVAWIALVVITLVVVQGTIRADFRDRPIAGDQATFLMQAESLAAPDHNMTYDAADMDRWRATGWVSSPTSLFFQRSPWGWAFAKPYAYSLFLAPFIAALDVATAVAVANTLLLLVLLALVIAILRLQYRGPVVPLVAIAFVFASYVYFYAYVMHQELLLATLTAAIGYLSFRAWRAKSFAWTASAVALMAVTLPEKPQFVALFVPIAAVLVWRQPGLAKRVGLVAVAAVLLFGATAPYRHYSGGKSWNAYQGTRFITQGPTPFDRVGLAVAVQCPPICKTNPDAPLTSIDGLRTKIEEGRDTGASFGYYFVGRYTGLLVFLPFALLVLVVVPIAFRKRFDAFAWATLLAIIGYIVLNIVVYPNNYYGGGQSLGDRYFIQMAPFVLVLLVATRASVRATIWMAGTGIALGVVMLVPHHLHPADAFIRIDETSPVQRLLPVEVNQDGVDFFRCPIYGDCASSAQVIPGFGKR